MERKIRHLELAAVVKNMHAKLRKQYKKGEDLEKLWSQHCMDKTELAKYATAMHELATEVWTTNNVDSRIDWCYVICIHYFLEDGLKNCLAKDLRRIKFDEMKSSNKNVAHSHNSSVNSKQERDIDKKTTIENLLTYKDKSIVKCSENSTDKISEGCCSHSFRTSAFDKDVKKTSTESAIVCEGSGTMKNHKFTPFKEKIRILDVGSCYNPFSAFQEFLPIAIDISPALESVYLCDFLELEITQQFSLERDFLDSFLSSLQSPIEKLPENSFHVVVFSLLLEYLPSHHQRWTCCEKAHKLLMINGLLLIITPDSHHQNKNAPMMKSWKKAIESFGFKRWRYEKLQHLHCMAFRKLSTLASNKDEIVSSEMLYIPQDFKDETVAAESETSLENQSNSIMWNASDKFCELPRFEGME